MGSKRRDQTTKGLLATDFKTRTDDEHINEEDKQALNTRRGKLAIPPNEKNPALSDLEEKRSQEGGEE